MNASKNYVLYSICMFALIMRSCLFSIKPLYKYYLKMYDDLSSEKLEDLRKFWKSDTFKSKLKDDKVVDQLIEFAQHLRDRYQDESQKIFALGQSPAYLVLTAALLEALSKNGNPSRYGFVAMSYSGGFKESVEKLQKISVSYITADDFKEFKTKLQAYAHYLEEVNFITPQKDTVVIADQVETGIGIVVFEFVLEKIKELDLVKENEFIPLIKWYIHTTNEYEDRIKEPKMRKEYFDLEKVRKAYNDQYLNDLKKQIGDYYIKNKKTEPSQEQFVEEQLKKHLEKYKNRQEDYIEENLQQFIEKHGTEEEFKKIMKPGYKIYFTQKDGQEGSVMEQMPEFDFSRNIEKYSNYPYELTASPNEKLRLVASFPFHVWDKKNPQEFVPDKEADMLVLRIIDRIKQITKE